MPLLQQWARQRPWLTTGFAGATSSVVNIASGLMTAAGAVGAFAIGSISTRFPTSEHPQRRRILRMLDQYPGLCYRELQSALESANGTLRHHLDVLQQQQSITVIPVNGRTCYFAGMPTQVEELRSIQAGAEKIASTLPIGLSRVQKQILESIETDGVPRSQAELARRLGRSFLACPTFCKFVLGRSARRRPLRKACAHASLTGACPLR